MIPSAWPGMDFQTFDSGINPLLASYVGAPYMIRATDPAPWARDTFAWWQANGVGAAGAADSATAGGQAAVTNAGWNPFDGIGDWVHRFWTDAGFILLGIIVVFVGLLFLWTA